MYFYIANKRIMTFILYNVLPLSSETVILDSSSLETV